MRTTSSSSTRWSLSWRSTWRSMRNKVNADYIRNLLIWKNRSNHHQAGPTQHQSVWPNSSPPTLGSWLHYMACIALKSSHSMLGPPDWSGARKKVLPAHCHERNVSILAENHLPNAKPPGSLGFHVNVVLFSTSRQPNGVFFFQRNDSRFLHLLFLDRALYSRSCKKWRFYTLWSLQWKG